MPYRPHELAPHIAALFSKVPHTDMRPVQLAMDHAIEALLAAEPTPLNLTDPDIGIPYALTINQSGHQEEVKVAGNLLRMCLHVVERGETTENERLFIPLQLAALAGYVPDRNRRASRQPRPNRSKTDALDSGLDDALRANLEGEWAELADWLNGEGVVSTWNGDTLTFTDGETDKTISIGTFQNRITAAKKRRKR